MITAVLQIIVKVLSLFERYAKTSYQKTTSRIAKMVRQVEKEDEDGR